MLLPTTYLTVLLAVFSWNSFLPAGFQIPTITWPTQKPQIISPQPSQSFPPTVTPTPTTKPTAIPTPTSKPTTTPRPTAKPTPKITVTTPPSSAGLLDSKQQYILDQINAYRASNGLSSVRANSETCNFAKTRVSEITSDFSHTGFTNRINNHSLPYSSYHNVTENIAMNSDYTQIVTMWKNSPGHAENMRSDTPYVCVSYSGNYYAYEGWKP